MYKDIPWVLAAGGSKGELAIWDVEEDMKVYTHFKGELSKKAKALKKTADKGLEAHETKMVGDEEAEGDSSGWEDVDSDEEDEETKEEAEESTEKQINTK